MLRPTSLVYLTWAALLAYSPSGKLFTTRGEFMNRVLSSAVVVAGLVRTRGRAVSGGQVPTDNDKTDQSGNTGGGTGALGSAELFGRYNTAYGYDALLNNTDGRHNTA